MAFGQWLRLDRTYATLAGGGQRTIRDAVNVTERAPVAKGFPVSMRALRPAAVALGIITAASPLVAACSVTTQESTGGCGPVVPNGAWDGLDRCVLESQVQSQLSKQVGQSVPPISCPNELDAELGANTVCTFTGAEGTFNVTVTVTNIDWGKVVMDDGSPGNFVSGNAEFDLKVADKPNP